MENSVLLQNYKVACRHLLSAQDRDAYSLTRGCFDRRYWGWKLVDFPEATFQRNVYPLAWWLDHDRSLSPGMKRMLTDSIVAGLTYSTCIQHADGSFDQAFPHEHSFGATAFLLHPLLEAYKVVRDVCSLPTRGSIEKSLQRSAHFLCSHEETHGFISNHIAGAALSLLTAARFFKETCLEQRASDLLERILMRQSKEGWFLEYDGADPGYQTLGMYYLAQIYRLRPEARLREALDRSISFLSWFIHPDGTFGGEYGSRRTAIYYPGGLALLGKESPLALRMTRFMMESAEAGRTASLGDMDMGNLAPLLSNLALVLDVESHDKRKLPPLPWEVAGNGQDFLEAGLSIRSTKRYYAVVGVSNGGVLKVFDRQKKTLLWNDGGYTGQMGRYWITTQMTDPHAEYKVAEGEVQFDKSFYIMPRSQPTPWQFVILRLINLTLMHSIHLGNMIKSILVKLLMRGTRRVPLTLSRAIRFEETRIVVRDELRLSKKIKLYWLQNGRPFVSIHMASAKYFENPDVAASDQSACSVDINKLLEAGYVDNRKVI